MFYKAKHGGFQEDSSAEEITIILQGMEINIFILSIETFVLGRGSQNPVGVHQTKLGIRYFSGPQSKRNDNGITFYIYFF